MPSRSQRHKVIHQGVASDGRIVAEGGAKPTVIKAIIDGIEQALPSLTELQPATASISDPDFTISCIGENFDETSKIIWMGAEEPTTLVSPTELTTTVKPSVVSSPTTIEVLIRSEVAGYPVDSDPQIFTWTEATPPARRG